MFSKILHIRIKSIHMWNKHWNIVMSEIDLHFNNNNMAIHYMFLLLGALYLKVIEFT
jgi:hypothetical protein